ncbi:putative flavonoid 3'-monooxygenase [Helianthus annuus]|nr:putative flavonoid 3'-monooxygenase [Helianthus annuus]
MILGNTSAVGSRHLGEELHIVSTNISEIFGRPNMSDFFPKLAWFDLQGVERDMKKQLKMMDEIIESMIEQRNKLNSKMSHDEVCDHEEKKDFLQILLELKNQEDGSPLDITHIKALLLVSKLYMYIYPMNLPPYIYIGQRSVKNHPLLREPRESCEHNQKYLKIIKKHTIFFNIFYKKIATFSSQILFFIFYFF